MKTASNIPLSAQAILVRYRDVLILPDAEEYENANLCVMIQAELMRLGYILSPEAEQHLATLSAEQINAFFRELIPILWDLKGADKSWRMFYPNFPKQVMKASESELFINAICHYWTGGTWLPHYKNNRRMPAIEATKFITLNLGNNDELLEIFNEILSSNASISDHDKKTLAWFVDNYGDDLEAAMPLTIPFKENLCCFTALHLRKGLSFEIKAMTSATDILRVMTSLSDGDVSLAENTKLKSLRRSERKYFINLLENLVNKDDISRHGEKWKRAFHGLHIGDYAKLAPKSYAIADQLRNGKIRTFQSLVEKALTEKDSAQLIALLSQRPGELARRLDHLLRILNEKECQTLLEVFDKLAERVDNRVLIQLYGHFKQRDKEITERLVLPKGSMAKAQLIKRNIPALSRTTVENVISSIKQTLLKQFTDRESLGNVWIDPQLNHCPIPLSQRSASDTLRTVARGTRLPLSQKNTLRMFIWWIGQDVDLSAVLYDEDFNNMGHISYTNLKIPSINACHSGDITRAPKGAAEFIDIDMDAAEFKGVRYIAMNVLDFTGKQFANYEECFAGWMTRDFPNANEAYEAKTVEQKIDLRSATKFAMPTIFDLKTREAIWVDLIANKSPGRSNCVENNAATIVDLMRGALTLERKMNLYELFSLHTEARGTLVENKAEADTIFSMEEGITPFDINKINSNYL